MAEIMKPTVPVTKPVAVQVPAPELNIDRLIKFGSIEKELEPIPGWKITMHTLGQSEKEKILEYLPANIEGNLRVEKSKIPTLIYAITKVNNEVFETEESKKILSGKLNQAQGTTIDLMYLEYLKIYAEQFDILAQGVKKNS